MTKYMSVSRFDGCASGDEQLLALRNLGTRWTKEQDMNVCAFGNISDPTMRVVE